MNKKINKQCDTRECEHCIDEDTCDLKEIKTDYDGNCIELTKEVNK